MAERLAELAAKAAVVPEWCQYAAPCGPAARHQGAWKAQPCELPDMHERLAELKERVARRQAVAAFGDSLAYAQPSLGRPQRKVRGGGSEARLKVCTAAAGHGWLNASILWAAARHAEGSCALNATGTHQCAQRPPVAHGIPSVSRTLLPSTALQAAAPTPAPIELSDMAERLSELCTKAAVVPQYCEYAQPAPAPAQRFAGAWAPQPYDRADLAERMGELAAKESARLALAALEDSLAYAQPGRPEKKVSCLGQLLDFWRHT